MEQPFDCLFKQNKTSGGSSETEVYELAVKPNILLLELVVITVTPVANCPITFLNSSVSTIGIKLKYCTKIRFFNTSNSKKLSKVAFLR